MAVRQIGVDSDGIWSGDLRMGGKRGDIESKRKIPKIVVRNRKEDARIFGEKRVTEEEIKGKSGKESV